MYQGAGLVFVSDKGLALKVDASALKKMRSFVQQSNVDHESGGVLLGRLIKNSPEVIIDGLTTPQRLDKSSPTRFYRHQQGHQALIEKCWQESEGTCNYLGEWHTHPEDYPHPSNIDLHNWIRLARETRQEFSGLFFLIIGRKAMCAYYVPRRSLKIIELYVQK